MSGGKAALPVVVLCLGQIALSVQRDPVIPDQLSGIAGCSWW